eukprot:6160753-Amphidinium_carterae.1
MLCSQPRSHEGGISMQEAFHANRLAHFPSYSKQIEEVAGRSVYIILDISTRPATRMMRAFDIMPQEGDTFLFYTRLNVDLTRSRVIFETNKPKSTLHQ